MNDLLMGFVAILWLISGVASIIWWWTKDSDFTNRELFMALVMSVFGPLNFIIGWAIHGDRAPPSDVLFRRRRAARTTEDDHE